MRIIYKITLFGIFVVVIIFFIILYVFKIFAITYIEFEKNNIRTTVPSKWSFEKSYEDNWQTFYFKSKKATLTIASKNIQRETKDILLSYKHKFKNTALIREITIYDNGLYIVIAKGRGRFAKIIRRYIAIFTKDNDLYWFELNTGDPFEEYKKVLDNALINLSIDNKKVNLNLRKQISKIKLPFWVLHTKNFFLIIVMGALILALVIPIIIISFSGRPVSKEKLGYERIIMEEENVAGTTRIMGRYDLQNYSIYLTESKLLIFSFGRKTLEILPEQTFDIKTGKGWFGDFLEINVYYNYRCRYRFYLKDVNTWLRTIRRILKNE